MDFANEPVVMRHAAESDRAFVEGVYFQTQQWLIEELFGFRGDDVERAKFAEFYDIHNSLIVSIGSRDVGWITVVREDDHIELAAIYLIPEVHGHGLGMRLIRSLIHEADDRGIAVTLSTAKINPARRLYERAGFRVTHEDRFKVYMRRPPT